MSDVLERIDKIADRLADEADAADELGRLPDDTAHRLRDTGIIRMLQPHDHAGLESHPAEFYEAVMGVAARHGAAGWVCGVVGVHPWELALSDERLQNEIWGADPDTWVASPYTPIGRARRVDGGYQLTGRWPFSSGTDHCSWIMLGGLVVDDDGEVTSPPRLLHFVLPRSDYTIVPDSWEVMGLRGTGSKDIDIASAFVPDHRVIDPAPLEDGTAARDAGRSQPLYSLPLGVVFPGAITAGTLGLAEGVLGAFVDYTRQRVSMWSGAKVAGNPFQLAALGEASADVAASRLQLLSDISRMFDLVASGASISIEQRIEVRRNQVRASRRAVDAVDKLFMVAGGSSTRLSNPLQRFWRDLHMSMNHVCNVADGPYQAYGLSTFGLPIPPTVKF